jgi:hypothetical protein
MTRSGSLRRASCVEMNYRGIPLVVEYFASGFDEDAYVEKIVSIQIGGNEVLSLFDETQQEDICERIQNSWDDLP